jgi:signal transduction histidine kinase
VGTPSEPVSPEPPEGGERERRGSYLGFVSHEVRNPLSTALWTAELLARMSPEDRGGARGAKLSAMCLRSVGRLRQLVEDHFIVERLDSAGLPMRVEPVAVREALEAVLARGADGAVATDVDDAAVVDADRALLERALDALVHAAARGGGAVAVGVRVADGAVRAEVRGDAAADDALEDPRKGSPSDTKGSALGLPAARRIAAALGGALAVEGGAFVLTLPRSAAYTPAPSRPGADPR